jgi:hypothetical protein
MSTIPYGIIKARRTTGGLLLTSSLAAVVGVVLVIGGWLTAAPEVHPIAQGFGNGTLNGPLSAPAPVYSPDTPSIPAPDNQLSALRVSDSAVVKSIPDGYWVPQLASNRSGTDKQGYQWDAAEILQDHLNRRNNYGGALLWSGDFMTFKSSDYWVTVVPSQASSTPEPVLDWCIAQNIDRDHCLAKRISTTSPYTGDNTKFLP